MNTKEKIKELIWNNRHDILYEYDETEASNRINLRMARYKEKYGLNVDLQNVIILDDNLLFTHESLYLITNNELIAIPYYNLKKVVPCSNGSLEFQMQDTDQSFYAIDDNLVTDKVCNLFDQLIDLLGREPIPYKEQIDAEENRQAYQNRILSIVAKVIMVGILSIVIYAFVTCATNCSERSTIENEPIVETITVSAEEQARLDSLARIEAAKAESLRIEQEKQRIIDLKHTIKIISVYPSRPNSAGGVDAHTVWKNTSNKTIKYISFQWTPYNAVGDVVDCEIRGFERAGGQVTGPIKPGQTYGYGYSWDCVWYNNTIRKIDLTDIRIEYMDGSTKFIGPGDIEYVYKRQ